MSEHKKSPLVPRLRFPEFRDKGEWEVKQLAKICDLNPSGSRLPEVFYYIDLESVESGELKARKMIHREEAPSRAQRILKTGDVIYQIVRPYQRNNYFFKIEDGNHYVASTGYAQLRAFESEVFLFQLIHTDDFVERVIAKCTGSNYPAINSSDLAEIPVVVPQPEEQQKIADCLFSIDELITFEAQKLNTLKSHKKGLMQQLFPCEGEILPRLRFPEFRNTVEWLSAPLGELAELKNGYAFKSVSYNDSGSYEIVTISNVQQGELVNNGIKRRIERIPSDLQPHHILRTGDTLISMTGNVGRVCRVKSEGMLLNQRVGKLVPKRISSDYLYYFMQRTEFREIMQLKAAGGAQGNLSTDDILSYRLHYPDNLSEQGKIADCLSSLDDLIAAHNQKVEALRRYKKGLMQQLFPVLDEASA